MKSELTIVPEGEELIIREGHALPLKEPSIVNIDGVLDSPLEWLKQRIDLINQKEAYVLVDREKMTVKLKLEETNFYGGSVSGSLELHPMFKLFSVNMGKYLTNFEMAQLIKMNRTVFESQSVAMSLVTELQNFKAKVEKELERQDNNRGNKRELINQVVDSNLPASFVLTMPIFKGTPKQTFEVEVYIKADDFSCTLISPTANDLIQEMRDEEIDRVLNGIKEVAPGIVIIEK